MKNFITKEEIILLIKESINELGATFAQNVPAVEEKSPIEESAPPDFPKSLLKKLIKQYGEGPKAYATAWKIHNAKRDGNKQVTEMWMAWENKSKQECAPCGCGDITDDHLGETKVYDDPGEANQELNDCEEARRALDIQTDELKEYIKNRQREKMSLAHDGHNVDILMLAQSCQKYLDLFNKIK